MRILVAHNHYIVPGGEDVAAAMEVELLRREGHEVLYFEMTNKDFESLSPFAKVRHLLSWDWSRTVHDRFRKELQAFRPDVAHFHNTFFMMTPSVYDACQAEGVPVVQSLHNFRLLCANALFFRDGTPCEECTAHGLRQGIRYGCYHHSRLLTWAVVRMLEKHWQRGTWTRKIDAFVVMSDFVRSRYVSNGLPSEKVFVKPNFLEPDPGVRTHDAGYVLFGGRLSEEKGVRTLIQAWQKLKNVPLVMAGTGPLAAELKQAASQQGLEGIFFAGFLGREAYFQQLRGARCLVVPSEWYENMPVTIVEAFACGIPVIASRIGSLDGIVKDGHNGLLFVPGDAAGLADCVRRLAEDKDLAVRLGAGARRSFEALYTARKNYDRLMDVYRHAQAAFVDIREVS